MKTYIKYIIAILLLTAIVTLITITIMNYRVTPELIYQVDSENLITDGGFENFNQTVSDCCNYNKDKSLVYASKSSDAFEGYFSLNLTSENQCACIGNKISSFNNKEKYLISFYYKGNKPIVNVWVTPDNKGMPYQVLNASSDWIHYVNKITFTDTSESASVYFYANFDGSDTVTNLYDDLEVKWLVPVKVSYYDFDFISNENYVIKTSPDNVVHNTQKEKLSDDGYYLVVGKPDVTLKFPYPELILLIAMMLIVIRILFKKEELIVIKR